MYVTDFKLSIIEALTHQLTATIDNLTAAPLTQQNVDAVARRPGVYQIFVHGDLLYVGKADKNLHGRLSRHVRAFQGRLNLAPQHVTFKALYVDEDLHSVAPEKLLIARHQSTGGAEWNHGGFGNNDPGRQRDSSEVKPTHFDALYPADISHRCDQITAGSYTVGELLTKLKRSVPWVFRYEAATEKSANQPPEYQGSVAVPTDAPTAEEAFETVISALPTGWQITMLPGYAIMYKEHRDYASAVQVFRS